MLTRRSQVIAGVLLLMIVTIEIGGVFMTQISNGNVATTDFQASFWRAGHGHAGVLVILSLVALLLADGARVAWGAVGWLARLAIPVGGVLMSTGFFLSALEDGATGPNGFVVILGLGGVSLAVGVVTLAVTLLVPSLQLPAGDRSAAHTSDARAS
ncbi:hypothetical protein [Kribbella sp. NPDC050470]|uniref:hypothetical protein n=1 Tax=unclassified Kribbella TaxID=2644121 RepID=UPI0037B7A84A